MDNQDSKIIIAEKKKKLDEINYGQKLYKKNVSISDKSYVVNNFMSKIVSDEFKEIRERLKKYNKGKDEQEKCYIGAISVGAHSNDYSNAFGFEIKDSWNRTPVMFVFENPSNNLNACSAQNMKTAKEKQKSDNQEDWNDLLCNVIWHAEYGIPEYRKKEVKYGRGRFQYFDKQKMYSELLLSIILEFKLANFYTTNMFRYEIFKDVNGEEKFQNLDAIAGLTDKKEEKIFSLKNEKCSFVEELKTFDPKLIFTTSKPYSYLKDYIQQNNKDIILVKLPHPAHPSLTDEHRFCMNAMSIINGLCKAKVLNKNKRDEKIIQAMERHLEFK